MCRYVSTEQPSTVHVGSLLYGGHTSVYLLMLLSFVVTSLNGVTLRVNSMARLPVLMRLVGLVALLALVWLSNSLWVRHFQHDVGDREGRISLIGLRDLVATRGASISPSAWLLAVILAITVLIIVVNVTFLFIQTQVYAISNNWSRFMLRSGVGTFVHRAKAHFAKKSWAQKWSEWATQSWRGCAGCLGSVGAWCMATWDSPTWLMTKLRESVLALTPVEDINDGFMESPLASNRGGFAKKTARSRRLIIGLDVPAPPPAAATIDSKYDPKYSAIADPDMRPEGESNPLALRWASLRTPAQVPAPALDPLTP